MTLKQQQKLDSCMQRKTAEANAARQGFQSQIGNRVLDRMARGFVVGAVRGAILGAAAGTPEFGIGAVPGAVFGGFVGGVAGAGAAAVNGIWIEPVRQSVYDYTDYKPSLNEASVACTGEALGAPPGPPSGP